MPSYADDDSRDEDPDPSDTDAGTEYAEQVPCPHCRKLIYEQAEQCPACGQYISDEETPEKKANWIFITVVLLVLAIVLFWIMGGRLF